MNDSAPATDPPGESAPPPGRLSLARLVGVMALSFFALIVGVTGFIAMSERTRLMDEAVGRAEGVASFLADHANRLFEVADVALASTRVAIGQRSWDELDHARDLFAMMSAIAHALPYIEDVWLNDMTGLLRLTSFGFPAPYSMAADRPAFQTVKVPGDDLHVGDLIVGRVTGRATFLISRRLENPDKSFRGMVSATADLAYFSDYWRGLRLPYDARIRLLRAENFAVLAAYPPAQPPAQPTDDDTATRAMLMAPAAPEVVNAASDGAIASFHRVGALPLYLEVAFSRAAVARAWRARLGTVLPFAAAALAALLGVTALAARQGRREAQARADTARARAELAAANARLESTVARRTAELRETNEEVQQFAYLISHDLRAPLVNVLGFARELGALGPELFDTEPRDAERTAWLRGEFEECLAFIGAGTTKMERLLGHILRLSRDGKRSMHPETIDMTALLRGLADAVRFQAAEARAEITIAALPSLTADRLAIEQIFGNLLDNAVKYLRADRPGRISVTARRIGERVAYAVADNGRGIAPHDRERVFELFRRAGAQDKPGEGIGLAHVRTLVRAMGGRVDVSAQRDGGSVFTVTLPVRPVA